MTRTLRLALAVLLALAAPLSVAAQQLAAHVSVPITITVRPTLAIRSVVPARVRTEPGSERSASTLVNVESNLPYRLSVRLAPATAGGARVLVRTADGSFEPLVPGASVTAVVSHAGGQRGHEVLCRVESADADRCALIYELTAEHDDMLLRSTASDYGLRTADSDRREALVGAAGARGGF